MGVYLELAVVAAVILMGSAVFICWQVCIAAKS